MANNAELKSGSKLKKGCLWAVGIVVGLGVLGALIGDPEDQSDASRASVTGESADEMNVATPIGSSNEDPSGIVSGLADQATARLTGPQRNAQRSARQYLDMTGFSRAGLIEQLSSSAGDGYNVADATVAVDSLNADWNQHAVRSARQYLDMMGFSCNGLIEQLSSSAGDRYIASEARYGAEQAGAC